MLTYAELDRRARSVAARLQRLEPERALLVFPPGLDYVAAVLGCLYAGVAAIPAYPPDLTRLSRSRARLLSILNDARPQVVLGTEEDIKAAASILDDVAAPAQPRLMWTDDSDVDLSARWRDPNLLADKVVLLQYTSGSTSEPKGVMVTLGNLMHNLEHIRRCFDIREREQAVIWLPPYHDMGLIGGILGGLYCGNALTLMSPVAFLKRPLRWLQIISHTRAVISGGPNFGYELCIRRAESSRPAFLDLSCWKVAFVGAEPIRAQTLDRFVETFREFGFRRHVFLPCYGLAESTLIATGQTREGEPRSRTVARRALEENRAVTADASTAGAVRVMSCGRPAPDQELLIVDPETALPRADNEIGEIWLAGPSVARGYWNRDEESRETFGARRSDAADTLYLRTGDLGFVCDGELFVTGRRKDMIICDGRNHYPEDIELTVQRSNGALGPNSCVAFSLDIDDREELAILVEMPRRYGEARESVVQEVTRDIRRAVAEAHDLRVEIVLVLSARQLLKTTSGKIQRQACREAFLAGKLRPWLKAKG